MAVVFLSVLLLAATSPSCAQTPKTLYSNSIFYGATNFTGYLTKTGLDKELKNPGNISVFAPTNAAFNALPSDVRQRLDSDPPFLTEVLSYHLVSDLVVASKLSNDQLFTSSSGAPLRFNKYNINGITKTTISGSPTVLSDLRCSNGYLFLMDRVIYPAPTGTALSYVNNAGTLTTLLLALTRAGLSDLFTNGNLTVFAPSNDAFSRLPAGELDTLLSDITKLQAVLRLHVVNSGTYFSPGLFQGEQLPSLNGETLHITESNGVFVNGAKISVPDVTVNNGVVHIIDDVLLPPSLQRITVT